MIHVGEYTKEKKCKNPRKMKKWVFDVYIGEKSYYYFYFAIGKLTKQDPHIA